jgi:hypothetical protein
LVLEQHQHNFFNGFLNLSTSSLIKIKAATPSLIVEAFAAVTVPSF